MKLNILRQLVKEELNSVLEDLKNTPLKGMNDGTYKIEYQTQAKGGGGEDTDSTKVSITKEEFKKNQNQPPYSFWLDITRTNVDDKIYKVTKVTRA
jgi:hypothetical protein